MPAAEALRVNYRTLALCCDSREVSRRMQQALPDFGMRAELMGTGTLRRRLPTVTLVKVDGDALEQRVAALVAKKAGLR